MIPISSILCTNPWAGPCEAEDCFVCRKGGHGPCGRPGCTYSIQCITCRDEGPSTVPTQGMRRPKEKGNQDKVWSANRLTPSTMESLAILDTQGVASTRQGCRRRTDPVHSGDIASFTMVGRQRSSPCLWCPRPPSLSSGRSGREWRSWQGTRTSSWTPRRSFSRGQSPVPECSEDLGDRFIDCCWATICFWLRGGYGGGVLIGRLSLLLFSFWYWTTVIFFVIVLKNRLIRGLCPKRSFNICLLFPKKYISTPNSVTRYHQSPWYQ